MKTKFFAIAAVVLGLASCAKDFAPEANVAGGEVDFTLAVSVPELAMTRAGLDGEDDGVNGHDSAYGAIDYLSEAEWNNVDLRYILEVYDFDESGKYVDENGEPVEPIKDRQVQIVESYKDVTFELRLVQGRNYHFVVFADFIEKKEDGTEVEYHTIGETLADITIKNDGINNELTDAYFATKKVNPGNPAHNTETIVLKRPYAKVRVVATDLAELNLNVDPALVEVTYNTTYPTAFNALTGAIGTKKAEVSYEYKYNDGVSKNSLANHYYTAGYDGDKEYTTTDLKGNTLRTHMTLFTDYILATEKQESINFTMTVYDDDEVKSEQTCIKTVPFITDIPVKRNHLTTIIGNVLTTATDVHVSINDNFENEDYQNWVFEAFINGGVVTLDQDYTIGSTLYVESDDVVLNLNGHSITNTAVNQKTDVIVVNEGAKLTINGDGAIEAVSGNDGYAIIVKGELVINGGTFKSGLDADGYQNAVIYTRHNDAKVTINGGEFRCADADASLPADRRDYRYTLNKWGSAQNSTFEVKGGRFYKYNPECSNSENPEMNFCADGYWATEDGDWYVVEKAMEGRYDEAANKVIAYSANDLLKWSWIVANENHSCSLDVMRNITLPMYTVEEDAPNKTYKYTTTPVTIVDGVPTDSNWKSAGTIQPSNIYYDGVVEGYGHRINNLTMTSTVYGTGFIGRMHNGEVHNLTFNNARLYSTTSYVAPLAYVEDGAYISNVHTTNSHIYGAGYVAGIAAEVQDRYTNAKYPDGRLRNMPSTRVENCSVDANTEIYSTASVAGGVAGQVYGSTLYNCTSKANVTGTVNVGGIAGHIWAYYADQHAYIINCSCEGAVITANDDVAGIVGRSEIHKQDSGTYAYNFIVGCNCDVTINSNGSRVGAIVSYNSHDVNYTSIYGCYAVSTLPVIAAGNAKAQTSFAVASKADITAEVTAKMNEGIAAYNAFAAAYVFPYTTPCQHDILLPQAKLW